MREFSRLATAAAAIIFISLPATVAPAQNAQAAETKMAAATTSTPADTKPAATPEQPAEPKKMHRSAHYHKPVPRAYEHWVPFNKMW